MEKPLTMRRGYCPFNEHDKKYYHSNSICICELCPYHKIVDHFIRTGEILPVERCQGVWCEDCEDEEKKEG